jgi:hypothetical protein
MISVTQWNGRYGGAIDIDGHQITFRDNGVFCVPPGCLNETEIFADTQITISNYYRCKLVGRPGHTTLFVRGVVDGSINDVCEARYVAGLGWKLFI